MKFNREYQRLLHEIRNEQKIERSENTFPLRQREKKRRDIASGIETLESEAVTDEEKQKVQDLTSGYDSLEADLFLDKI